MSASKFVVCESPHGGTLSKLQDSLDWRPGDEGANLFDFNSGASPRPVIGNRFMISEEVREGNRVVVAHTLKCPLSSRTRPDGSVDTNAPTECRCDFQKRLLEHDAQRAASQPEAKWLRLLRFAGQGIGSSFW